MAYYLSKLNPIPALPEYSGPHKVGTVDIEIPVSELNSPGPAPDSAADIYTVQFRIFYPARPDSTGKRITWLPAPQRNHVSAYTKFLGFGPVVAEALSFLPRHLHYTSIPVHKNASLLEPTDLPGQRWPTMIFSHGLGGNRNAYSHVAGSLASHGVVVVCPEHRDGSSAISFIRDPAAQESFFIRNTRRAMPYVRIPHTQTQETWDARNAQLKIRLWEMGLIHEAVLNIDLGVGMTNLNGSTPSVAVEQLRDKLNVQEPGSIIFGGHSFGGATMVQFMKSVHYADHPEVKAMADPLYRPSPDSRIRAQITEKNPIILLDMWCFPLLASSTAALYHLPLPAYADVPSAPGGTAILAIESETFFKWTEHLHATARILSPDPAAAVVSAAAFERPSGIRLPEPNVFYVQNSAHLSQSDFGVLFPWLTRKVFGAEEPERALRLNLRALLQLLRINDVPVARTWAGDLVDGGALAGKPVDGEEDHSGSQDEGGTSETDGIEDDKAIFDRSNDGAATVQAWCWIDIVGLGSETGEGGEGKDGQPAKIEGEPEMEDVIEAQLTAEDATATTGAKIERVVSAAA
ncbi:Phospholipase A2 [Pleurostoma richardsiae]|uniref:Putative phospholipase n=1 Tax=Pleurostoma richardsiae TaxID=41990 RepID=A0AA38RDQ2_9PEZI|nr:Phospholipase A2 [Pleurostoma richardsiae]